MAEKQIEQEMVIELIWTLWRCYQTRCLYVTNGVQGIATIRHEIQAHDSCSVLP